MDKVILHSLAAIYFLGGCRSPRIEYIDPPPPEPIADLPGDLERPETVHHDGNRLSVKQVKRELTTLLEHGTATISNLRQLRAICMLDGDYECRLRAVAAEKALKMPKIAPENPFRCDR